jgi:phage-related protein
VGSVVEGSRLVLSHCVITRPAPKYYEIRIRGAAGAFRVVYVAKFEEAVYVLHAFQKKTRKTSQEDIELAVQRYRLIGEQS